jgi:hypothetical protein
MPLMVRFSSLTKTFGGRYTRRPPPALYAALLGLALLLFTGCGRLPVVPATFDPQAYKPITYQDLLTPHQAGLAAGEKVKVRAYFWQYLTYEPAMVQNYLTLLCYPLKWYRLQWFALYGSEEMTGYYDLAAMSPEQAEHHALKRLEPIVIYGELAPLPPVLYLRVDYIEKVPSD